MYVYNPTPRHPVTPYNQTQPCRPPVDEPIHFAPVTGGLHRFLDGKQLPTPAASPAAGNASGGGAS